MRRVIVASGTRKARAISVVVKPPTARKVSAICDAGDARKYLTALVRNAARNLRRRHHRARPHLPADAEALALAAEAPSAEEQLVSVEDHVQLLGCVKQLAEAQRRVVDLRMLQEASGEEVARELGLTPGHVAVLLHRAKKELLRCMTA